MGRVRVFVCASVSFSSQGSFSDVVALWAVSGFRFVLYSFGSKVSLATGSPFGMSSVWWRLRLLPPSGSFICVLLRLRWLSLHRGFAFFEFSWLSSFVCSCCNSCASLPWSGGSLVSVSRPAVFYESLLLCGRSVVIVGSLPRSDLRFPLMTGSPCGTSQCLLVFGSVVLSLHVFFGRGVLGCCLPFCPCRCFLGVPLVEMSFYFFFWVVPSGSSTVRDVAVSSLPALFLGGAYASLIFL